MKVKTLSTVDAAYLAGFIDGEGTVTLSRKHKNENRQLAVTISNTERQILEFCIDVIGTGKITNKRVTQSHHTPSFTYAVYNRQALTLLEQIEPYLRSYKSRRVELILKNYIALTPRNGKYTDSLLKKRKEFEKTVLESKSI